MSNAALEAAIEAAWEIRDQITPATKGEAREAVEATLEALEHAELRYRHIFEYASEDIFQTTREGRYLAANPALPVPEPATAALGMLGLAVLSCRRHRA